MSTHPDTISKSIEDAISDPKAQGNPSGGSGLGATPCSRELLTDLVDALERYGHGASLMHPRLTRAMTAARKHLSENDQ